MLSLSDKNPWPNKQFEDGHHAVRYSNRFWAELWSDLNVLVVLQEEEALKKMLEIFGLLVSVTVLLFMNLLSNFQVLVLVQGIKY